MFMASIRPAKREVKFIFLTVTGNCSKNYHTTALDGMEPTTAIQCQRPIIGFILMLTPIGEIKEFDPSLIQQLLSTMSGGMAVALYTTLAGLLTSSLLKVQYHFLDSVLVSHVNQLTKKLHAHDKDQS